jgi:hypothetical protein
VVGLLETKEKEKEKRKRRRHDTENIQKKYSKREWLGKE